MAFTFGKRCSLCGGKLNSQLRCTECGLDNTKNDNMYRDILNKNNCDGKPLTHVHEDSHQESTIQPDLQELKERLQKKYAGRNAGRTGSQNTWNSTKKSAQPKSQAGKILGIIIAIFAVFPSLIGMFFEIVEENFYSENWNRYEEEWVDSDAVYQYEEYLSSGFYTVGVHLPEGTYDIWFDWGDYAYLDMYQYVDGELISIGFECFDWDDAVYVEDIYLEEGTILKISLNAGLCFACDYDPEYTENWAVNPLTEEYTVSDTAVAGQDFPAGVYDIYYSASEMDYENGSYGSVGYEVWDAEKQEIIMGETLYIDSNLWGEVWYYNVALPEGASITLTDLEKVTLYPSSIVDPMVLENMGTAL